MIRVKKNDLLIGFTISILISLFVNFALLMRKYEFENGDHPLGIQPPSDLTVYFPLAWFFLFSLILFIVNDQTYKLGEVVFHKKEYKSLLFASITSLVVAYGIFRLYPVVSDTILVDWLQIEDTRAHPPKEITITLSREHMATQTHIPPPSVRISRKAEAFPRPFVTEHLFVFMTVMLSVLLVRLLGSKQQMKLEFEQLKTEKLQNSYNALMGQINPHFFFNSLNGLNSLIQNGEKEQTLTYLGELSDVFRYILQSNKKELVTLAEELQFVKAYTYLLGVRYEGKLFFSFQADTLYLLWYLPILSVLPLIENAVKHNVISKQHPLRIDIYTTADNQLVISNKIHPKAEDSCGSGIGLKNLWGRYRMLTGKDIQISNRKEYFKVSLPLLNKPIHS